MVPSQPTEDEAHAIYISVIEIDHRDAAQPVQVKIKVFTDDLENALRNAYGHPFKLPDAQACVREGTSIEGYFQKHFKVKIDGNQVAISFEKGEKNADSTWLYFHLYGPGKWNELLVTADFFMELFPTQTTTLTVYDGGKLWFNKFTKGETVCRITL
ncbi:MAG: hypothetical protein OER04_15945 [Cyclobacteriaceae bacterium]|nr:hypothetical protein [Cyclobacteriaceae bacterium]